jgi:hypothetical protein
MTKVKEFDSYQHPLEQTYKKQCLEIDFFTTGYLYISVLQLQRDPRNFGRDYG